MALKIFKWLAQEPGSIKHEQWKHPLTSVFIHYSIFISTSILLHDYYFQGDKGLPLESSSSSSSSNSKRSETALFLFVYVFILFSIRLATEQKPHVFYEMTWMCNSTLLLGAIGIGTNRTLLSTGAALSVSIDQILWYIDIPYYFIFGAFPIGVAKYLTWKEKHWSTKITCTHHLWTMPLLLSFFINKPYKLWCYAYVMSVYFVMCQVLISNWLIPLQIKSNNEKSKKYLNVNLSHEVWKDIKFEFLQISYGNPKNLVYLLRLFWKWNLLNFIVFFILVFTVQFYNMLLR